MARALTPQLQDHETIPSSQAVLHSGNLVSILIHGLAWISSRMRPLQGHPGSPRAHPQPNPQDDVTLFLSPVPDGYPTYPSFNNYHQSYIYKETGATICTSGCVSLTLSGRVMT